MPQTFAPPNPSMRVNTLPPEPVTEGYRQEAHRQLHPWEDENGLINRVPTNEEAKEWARSVQPVALEVQLIPAPLTEQEGRVSRFSGRAVLGKLGLKRSETPVDDSVLGRKDKGGEADDYLAQPATEVFGYGNESERLAKLRKLDVATLKKKLLTMNRKLRERGVDDAKEEGGFTMAGRFSGGINKIAHIYPDFRDTEDVLAYALDKAQKANDTQSAALILSGGFVAAHPFNDGNGRESRAIYSELSMGLNPDTKMYNQATTSSSMSREVGGGSALVNLGTNVISKDPTLQKMLVDTIYTRTDMTRYKARPAGLNYDQDPATGSFYGPPAKAYEGLDEQQKIWLEDAYFNVRDVSLSRDHLVADRGRDESFRFALSYAAEKLPGVMRPFEAGEGPNDRLIAVDRIFASGDKELIAAIADGAREYYKEYALACIDMLGAGEVAARQIEHPGGGRITVKDRIIELSNNFLSEKVGPNSVPLESRLRQDNQR